MKWIALVACLLALGCENKPKYVAEDSAPIYAPARAATFEKTGWIESCTAVGIDSVKVVLVATDACVDVWEECGVAFCDDWTTCNGLVRMYWSDSPSMPGHVEYTSESSDCWPLTHTWTFTLAWEEIETGGQGLADGTFAIWAIFETISNDEHITGCYNCPPFTAGSGGGKTKWQ